jgi:hypothetical protein
MPLNLPDKLPAIELLKEENIFVIDNSRATQQDIRPLRIESDAVEDYDGNRFGAFAVQYSVAGGDFVYENQEPYLKEYSDRAYENFLHGF